MSILLMVPTIPIRCSLPTANRLVIAPWLIMCMTLLANHTILAQTLPPPPQGSATQGALAKDNTVPAPGDNIRYGYVVHQTLELGGHLVDNSGSGSVYDTLVNLHSGPRVLTQSLTMRAVKPLQTKYFDTLTTNSFGYAGDPNSVSYLNISKGRAYDFRGSFRRDRQYFDYNLLDNPLIPTDSSPFVPADHSPHLFNTVRRNTDLNLTLAPLSPFSVRVAYNRNISRGPVYSSVHFGTEASLLQDWRNTSDSYAGGVDWKFARLSSISYDQFITLYKADTQSRLNGLDYKLSDGSPISLGIDLSSIWKTPCASPFNSDGSVNPKCNAFQSYERSAPTRTTFPTEQLRFQSAALQHITLNGRLLYSGSTSRLTNFNEVFKGLQSRTALRESILSGSARARRSNVNGDLSLAWLVGHGIEVTNTYDFWNFHVPGTNNLSETDYTGTSLLVAPVLSTDPPTVTADSTFLNQKTKTNTILVAWDATSRARMSVGYRYRGRLITNDGGDIIPIHEHWALFGSALRPSPKWRLNVDVDAMYADNAFTRISPRQMQNYRLRASYKPQSWVNLSGGFNIREARDNVATVNHLEHNRNFSFAASVSPHERWSLDADYGFDSVFSSTIECYVSSTPPSTAGIAPGVCADAGTPQASTGYYNAPTQFGTVSFRIVPVKRIQLNAGYRISAVAGNADIINIRQLNGSLQSRFQSPFASLLFNLAPNWTWKANYNYYGYGEGSPQGLTASRSFRSNIYTFAVQYAF